MCDAQQAEVMIRHMIEEMPFQSSQQVGSAHANQASPRVGVALIWQAPALMVHEGGNLWERRGDRTRHNRRVALQPIKADNSGSTQEPAPSRN